MRKSVFASGAALLLLMACSPEVPGEPVTGDAAATTAESKNPAAKDLVVYTQNVYVGADLDAVLSSPPELLEANLFSALQTFAATNWPERAATIAGFIAAARPDVVALNEVSTVTVTGLEPLFPDTHVEFLPILMAALSARGLDYSVAGQVANIDANLPLGGPTIRLQDYDVVLTRNGITTSNVTAVNYAAHAPVTLAPGITIDLVRGYVAVDIAEGGRAARFVTTHLEDKSAELHMAQGAELISTLAASPNPVVIAGDLNTGPTDPGAYAVLLSSGYQDAWLSRIDLRRSNGFTCCHSSPDLRNPFQDFTKRIDLVMVRPDGKAGKSTIRPVDFTLVGDDATERTASGMWPSDHAGVIARLEWKKVDRK